ncbi:hypothetical protein [Streptomyces sp. NRRL S-1813]|nr:hypothetical protein [Streptomyces sp. NRRL S-1813]
MPTVGPAAGTRRPGIAQLAPDRQQLLYEALPALEELVAWEKPPAGPQPR